MTRNAGTPCIYKWTKCHVNSWVYIQVCNWMDNNEFFKFLPEQKIYKKFMTVFFLLLRQFLRNCNPKRTRIWYKSRSLSPQIGGLRQPPFLKWIGYEFSALQTIFSLNGLYKRTFVLFAFFNLLLLDLLRNECSHIQHIRCTNTPTSYMLKTHTYDKINLKNIKSNFLHKTSPYTIFHSRQATPSMLSELLAIKSTRLEGEFISWYNLLNHFGISNTLV